MAARWVRGALRLPDNDPKITAVRWFEIAEARSVLEPFGVLDAVLASPLVLAPRYRE